MNHESFGACSKIDVDTANLARFNNLVNQFDPGKMGASWSPESGGDMIVELKNLSETLRKKSAEIKQYIRTLTVEELNDLDGFDRCRVAPQDQADELGW